MAVAPTHSVAHPQNGETRDVEQELARQRAEKRRQTGAVSPVEFHKDLLVGDDWNCMFLNRLCSGVTMHQFYEPPSSVLDLGCGSGLWVIEAAKVWPDTTFVGFDLRNLQPDLAQSNLGIEYRDLSQRIKWVHGDFLDPLPFEANHFDFVRICCIGLDVPEDSWQELLEECARVMRPGGALEVFEEDPIFPAGRTRKPEAERTSNLHTVSIRRQSGERNRSDSAASQWTAGTSQSQSSASNSSLVFTTERNTQSASGDSWLSTASSQADSTHHLFTQDHERLKRAWEQMLAQRFLSHKLLTVLPFYISSFFHNVEVHPPMNILLPPPSSLKPPSFVADREVELEGDALRKWVDGMRSNTVQLDGQATARIDTSAALRSRPPMATVSTWGTLHLARQFRIVSACKESIWQAYRALDVEDERGSVVRGEPPRDDLRDEFEREWGNWEEDMKDRMGIRVHIQDELQWQDPDSRSTFAGSESIRSSQAASTKTARSQRSVSNADKAPLCRAMRGFIAWKKISEPSL
ncbi:S-adenosyl-L-methionine-dependent methyltransferase [Polyporus arcularius HHB13444]|uniref:S-adenosyl-L-methionine-dependent methyltransferase n=1 Tax=Polyporus arcularius HHB13444 TaxID=1314778 RepID=A0A5C3PV57_9APHY|nr:S-adenosyl-L-methionine-dependent methyltransferase [Polyporus arcularius HHB13444]